MDQESLDFAYTAFLIFGGFGAAAYVYMKLWAPDFGSFESEEFKLDYKFADKAPVEDIFLNYKHKSLEHWQLWINAEAPSLREEAFKLLKAYLDKPPSKYGYIAKDVVTSMAKLKDVDCFDYLYNIGIKVRDAWAQSKASSVFYKEILNSLVSLDCKKAKDLLAIEVKEAASSGDSEEIQKNILQSVMTMNSHEDISNTFAKILLENELSIDFKLQGLKMLEENGDKKLSVLVGILNKMVRGEETDFQLFSHCFSLLLEAIGENTIIGRKTVVDCLNDRKLADEAIRILETRILNKALNLDTRLLFMIISKVKWKSYLSLQKSLFQRFECDDFEKAIIEQADSYEKSSLVPASQDQIIQVLTWSHI